MIRLIVLMIMAMMVDEKPSLPFVMVYMFLMGSIATDFIRGKWD